MPFDILTRTVLQHYTTNPPPTEDLWYGPWNTTQGYMVAPQRRLPDDPQSHIPDFIIEVVKISTSPLTFRCVLIVEIKNSQHWESGIPALERQLNRQTDAAFAGTAHSKVYWIGTICPPRHRWFVHLAWSGFRWGALYCDGSWVAARKKGEGEAACYPSSVVTS